LVLWYGVKCMEWNILPITICHIQDGDLKWSPGMKSEEQGALKTEA
jgi:hypothetical protein